MSHLSSRLIVVIYFTACYIYILLRLQPGLLYQCQVPPFYWSRIFAQQFLAFPGGISVYLSNLLSQFYYYPWLGAFILTILLWLNFELSRMVLGRFSPHIRHSIVPFIPVILLLTMFNQYEHRLSFTIAWVFSLVFFVVYLTSESRPTIFRLAVFSLSAVILYYIGAGFLHVYALLVLLTELLYHRSVLSAVICIAGILLLPWLSQQIFVLTTKNAFCFLLQPIYDYRPPVTPFILYFYFPISVILMRSGKKTTAFFKRLQRTKTAALALLLTACAAWFSFDRDMYTILKVNQYARDRQWDKIMNFTERSPSNDALVVFLTNQALYHTGKLTTDLFSRPQNWGTDGLYLPPRLRTFFSLQVSDFYWDMGYLNEAHHWAQEDHTNYHYSPHHLQRLALTGILKGDTGLAEMCLKELQKTILYQKWAENHKEYLTDPRAARENTRFSHLVKYAYQDFIVNPLLPGEDLESIASQNPDDIMAFEYLMADYMLSFRLGKFFRRFRSSIYWKSPYVPRLYQEALMVYLYNTQTRNDSTIWTRIERGTIEDFNHFMNILKKNDGDRFRARDELKKNFGTSYWYYNLYHHFKVENKKP